MWKNTQGYRFVQTYQSNVVRSPPRIVGRVNNQVVRDNPDLLFFGYFSINSPQIDDSYISTSEQ
jgi:hypothetical protein